MEILIVVLWLTIGVITNGFCTSVIFNNVGSDSKINIRAMYMFSLSIVIFGPVSLVVFLFVFGLKDLTYCGFMLLPQQRFSPFKMEGRYTAGDAERAEMYPDIRRIVCSAVRAKDGEVIIGIRHYSPDMINQIKVRPDGNKFRFGVDQGFVDQWGNFLNRTDARVIAENQGQIVRDPDFGGDELRSENLY